MIDRLASFESIVNLEKAYVAHASDLFLPRYNAFPTLQLPVVRGGAKEVMIEQRYWGVTPDMASQKSLTKRLFAVSLDDLKTKPIYKNTLLTKRCIIPVNGLFAMRPIGKKKVVPTYIFPANGRLFHLAGICDTTEDFNGNAFKNFLMIVQPAHESMNDFSDTMPMIVKDGELQNWLGIVKEQEMINNMVGDLKFENLGSYPVTPKILDNNLNHEKLLERIVPADQFGNYTLFDF